MRRDQGQLSLSDSLVPGDLGSNVRLDRIDGLIDWPAVEAVAAPVYASPTGRPAYPVLVMIKAALLQHWYGLSDPGLEEALGDRLSFRRFAGLGLEDGTPDHSTISRFRKQLVAHDLATALFEEITGQLERAGLMVKQGTLIDASLVAAQAKVPSPSAGPGAASKTDPDADWTRQYGKSHFGYKIHIAVDQRSQLIRRARLTSAKVYESLVADDLIMGDEKAVYADKAYEHKERRKRLKQAGIKDRILHRSHKHQKGLPHWQARRNRLINPIRAQVEKVFGTLKRCYGYTQVRYMSHGANHVQMMFLCMSYNLRRAERLSFP